MLSSEIIFLCGIPEIIQFAEDVFVFDVAAGVPSQRGSANTAGQAAHVPAEVIHLQSTGDEHPSTPVPTTLYPILISSIHTDKAEHHTYHDSQKIYLQGKTFFLQSCMHSKG